MGDEGFYIAGWTPVRPKELRPAIEEEGEGRERPDGMPETEEEIEEET